MYQLLKPKRILQTMATSSSDDITSQQVSDSGFIIFSRNNFDAMGRRRRPLAARSAAPSDRPPENPDQLETIKHGPGETQMYLARHKVH